MASRSRAQRQQRQAAHLGPRRPALNLHVYRAQSVLGQIYRIPADAAAAAVTRLILARHQAASFEIPVPMSP